MRVYTMSNVHSGEQRPITEFDSATIAWIIENGESVPGSDVASTAWDEQARIIMSLKARGLLP